MPLLSSNQVLSAVGRRSRNRFLWFSSSTTTSDEEWKSAKPFNEIPGPSTFKLVRAFLPGGKYQNLNVTELSIKLQEEYGNLAKFPGIFGQRDMLFTFDANDVERIFRTEGKFPARRGLDTLEYFRKTYRKDWFEKGAGLVPTYGSEWFEFRTKVNQIMLQPKTAKLYVPRVDEVTCELVAKIKENRDANSETPADFLNNLNEWALESIGVIALDRRLGVMENPQSSDINRLMKEIFKLSYEYDIMPSIWRTFKTPGFNNVMKTYEKLTGIMKDYADDAMKKFDNTKPSLDHEAGVLEKLMKVDKHVAFVMVLDALIAGVDTTTTGAVSVLYSLARNSEKQEILRKEIMNILPEKNSKLTTQSLNNIPYLRAVIKEALRLNPPISGNARDAGQDLVIQGYQIPKHTMMLLATHVTALQDQYFERSKEFIPERWLKDNVTPGCPHSKDLNPFANLPFGFGPRMCVGRRFAELEIEVLTIRMIREFKLEWNHPDLKFKSYLFNTPADPLRFKTVDTQI